MNLHILSFLAPKDLLKFGLASRLFHELANDDSLWKKHCKKSGNVSIPLLNYACRKGYWKKAFAYPESWNFEIIRLCLKSIKHINPDIYFYGEDPTDRVAFQIDRMPIGFLRLPGMVDEVVKTIFGGPASYENLKPREKFETGFYREKSKIEIIYSFNAAGREVKHSTKFYRAKYGWYLQFPNPLFADFPYLIPVIDCTGLVYRWDIIVKIHTLFHGEGIIKKNVIFKV